MATQKKPQAEKNPPAKGVIVKKTEKPMGGKKALKVIAIAVSALLIALYASYAALAYVGSDKSLPGLRFYGYKVGGKTYSQIKSVVQSVAKTKKDEKVKVIIGNQNEKEAIEKTYFDLGIYVDAENTARKIYYFGKVGDFPSPGYVLSFITGKSKVSPVINWAPDSEKKISDAFTSRNIDPEDAKLKLDGENVVVEPEKQGAKVNLRKLQSDIEQQFYAKNSTPITAQIIYELSKITQKDIEPYLNELNDFIGRSLTVQYSYKKFKLTKEDLLSFIDLEKTLENKTLTLNDGGIEDYLDKIASKINIKGKPKQISSYDGSVISEGREGWRVNLAESKNGVKDALEKHEKVALISVEVAPIEEETVDPGFTPGKYPGKYIEINLAEQMLYQWEGTNMVGSHRVSTGKWSMPTPTGDFSINNKDPRAYSREYELYMPWWMSFVGSQYGIHELPEWPDGTKEGEGHLGTPVSHGCVRLGIGDAQAVYDWAEIGTPVYVHT